MANISEGVLLGLGNPLLDITVTADQQFLDKYGLSANNAIIAEAKHLEMFEEMMKFPDPHYMAGGATQNSIRVAQWLLQRKNATTFFGGVGDDEKSEILRKIAEEAGVKVLYCINNIAPTGTCGALITGENRSLVAHLGAADYFTHEWMEQPEQWSYIEKAKVFYIGGFVFTVCHGAIFDIAQHCSENNKTLAMNLSAPFLCKYFADQNHNILQHIDILFGNETEAATFCKHMGLPTEDISEMALLTSGLPKANKNRDRIVIFTQGKDPTVVAYKGSVRQYPVEHVPKEVIKDTNGCGDAFVGGFLAQLVQDKDLEDCIRCGMYAARVVIEHWGCNYPKMPNF